jgi:hypothetical protein
VVRQEPGNASEDNGQTNAGHAEVKTTGKTNAGHAESENNGQI